MQQYVTRRLIWLVVVLIGISVVAFALVYVLPGDPARVIAGPRASQEAVNTLRVKWGLDRPLPVQYLDYMKRVFRGDLGRSFYFKVEVFPAILHRLPASGLLAACGLLVALLVGVPTGVISAVRQYSWMDRTVMLASLAGITLPVFFQGLLLIYVLAYLLNLFPIGGYGGVRHIVLPAVTLGIHTGAWYARVLRSAMLDIMGEDYVRTARAKGLRETVVIVRHALRNALGPLITMVGADMGYYLGGVLVVERIFGWPGIGMQAWSAIAYRDMPMIMGTVLFAAFFVVLANLAVDVLQVFVDPRIRYQ
jgi:peptide/nickel transport system permease protein